MLEKLFSSKIRVALLEILLGNSDRRYYLREITRLTKHDIKNISRELNNLESIGLVESNKRGNLKYYSVRKDFAIYPELKAIISKTKGTIGSLKETLSKIKGIDVAFIYGSFAKNKENVDSDIDLIILGKPDITVLNEFISVLEKKLNREINYSVFSKEEFYEKRKIKDSFMSEISREKKIFIIGSENDF
ncbi:MAG: nucleotidyltransferase domain-containing protein [Candidatus Omnitrophica bacterium]|nr:nucleotidyltransferase domain-containing protein [Candidatus Omnitrophota bacterium]